MAPAAKYSSEEQEAMILEAAAECIVESSLMDFTMSSVAKKAGLSMGSVYKHVQSKEDLILALANVSFRHQSAVFSQVLSLDMPTPSKIVAIALLSPHKIQHFEFDAALQAFAVNEAVIKRASKNWTDRLVLAHAACENQFTKAVQKGIEAGELEHKQGLDALIAELNVGCWALMVGFENVQRITEFRQIVNGTDSLKEPLAIDSAAIKNLVRLVNSYPWKEPFQQSSLTTLTETLAALGLR
jgi:AcrR family transcriptional regulator